MGITTSISPVSPKEGNSSPFQKEWSCKLISCFGGWGGAVVVVEVVEVVEVVDNSVSKSG